MFAQALRQDELERKGWIVVRFTWRELDDPAHVVAKIRHALRRTGRSLVVDPSTVPAWVRSQG